MNQNSVTVDMEVVNGRRMCKYSLIESTFVENSMQYNIVNI